MKKRLFACVLAAAMCVMTACGGSSSSSASAAAPAADTAASAKSETAVEETAAASTATETASASETATEGSGETIKIGLMLQLSGSSPADSQELLEGCQMLADLINNKTEGVNLPLAETEGLPNLGGAKVEIVVGDVPTNDAAMSECERLITEEDAKAFCGIIGSSGVKIAATAFEKYQIPYVTNASSPTLTSSGYQYVVRIFPDDSIYCRGAYDLIKELNDNGAGIKTVALCSEDSEFGTNITQMEADLAAEYGLDVVSTISYNAAATNVTSEVLQLKQADADVVMMSSYTADAILFMQTMKEQNYLPKMLVGQRGGYSRNDMFLTLGNDMNYIFNTSAWSTDLAAPNVELMTQMFADYTGGKQIQEGVMRAMTDFYAICLAMNQAGSTDADAIMEQFRAGIEIPDDQKWISVDIQVDENGQNLTNGTLVLQAFDGTGYKTVYPEAVASADYVYPMPGWDER